MADGVEAVVLRTLRYGEADLIAHVYTRHAGRRGVIAKGARRPKSRLGTRLEPFLALDLQLHHGRGDLAVVRGASVLAEHPLLRASWRAQQLAAAALELVTALTVEHQSSEPLYHLLRNFLALLDGAARPGADDGSDLRQQVLLAAFELKLLHVVGIAPQLGACVRCGAEEAAGFSAADGGIVCSACRAPGDAVLDERVLDAAVMLTRQPLAHLAAAPLDELPTARALRSAAQVIVTPTCREHAGVRPRRRS